MEVLLAIVAIVVSVVAIVCEVLFYRWQTRQGERIGASVTEQGERIGMSVISTVDQIYRKTRDREAAEDVEEFDDEYVAAKCEPRFVRRNEDVQLTLEWVIWEMKDSHIQSYVECVVERPATSRDRMKAKVDLSTKDYTVTYPGDFPAGSTDDPGRYHVRWRLTDEWTEIASSTGRRFDRVQIFGSAEDSFGVLP